MTYSTLSLSAEPVSAEPVPEVLPPVERQVYRNAMARLAAAVNIITSAGDDGWCGFTASAVSSVTDTPPTLLVCVNRGVQAYATIAARRILCVNTVAGPHEQLSMLFAGAGGTKDMATRFAGGEWTTLVTGAPVLVGAAVAFDCRVVEIASIGTHDVLYCEVVAVREGATDDALVYVGRRFHRLA